MSTDMIMTPELAQKTIQSCIDNYLAYLCDVKHTPKSSRNRYRCMLNSVLKRIEVPFMSITNQILNDTLKEVYKEKHWTTAYLNGVIIQLSRLFHWAKNHDPKKPYTSKEIIISSPVGYLDVKNSSAKFVINDSNVKITEDVKKEKVSKNTKTKQTSNTKPKKTESSTKTMADPDMNFSLANQEVNHIQNWRNDAISALYECSNITMGEICKLSIYDFLHNHIVVQSTTNRTNMRIIKLDIYTRNLIYRYLETRTDNYEYLFLGNQPGSSITVQELNIVLVNSIKK